MKYKAGKYVVELTEADCWHLQTSVVVGINTNQILHPYTEPETPVKDEVKLHVTGDLTKSQCMMCGFFGTTKEYEAHKCWERFELKQETPVKDEVRTTYSIYSDMRNPITMKDLVDDKPNDEVKEFIKRNMHGECFHIESAMTFYDFAEALEARIMRKLTTNQGDKT